MTDVYTLLSFPTSEAFKDYRTSEFTINLGSSSQARTPSPPHKIPRLDADLDSASASRSRLIAEDPIGSERKAKVTIQIAGPAIQTYTDRHFDQDFTLLKRTLRVLLSRQAAAANEKLPATYERIYSACRVCVSQRGEGLYGNFKLELERCVQDIARRLLQEPKTGVLWHVVFVEACDWFEKQVGLLESLFAYLDRAYINALPGAPSIQSTCYAQFADGIFGDATISRRLQDGIEQWVDEERTTSTKHELRPTISELISRLQHHGQYDSVFETPYISITSTFYKIESEEKAGRLDAQKFLLHCQKRRGEEMERAKEVIPEISWRGIKDATERALLEGRMQWLVDNALGPLMKSRAEGDLRRMYRLFVAVDGVQVFLDGWMKYIEAKVKTIVTDKERDDEMVKILLEFKSFADHLLNDTFADTIAPPSTAGTTAPASSSPVKQEPEDVKVDIDWDASPAQATHKQPNQLFQYALSDAFRRGFKARRNKPAEMLAKNIDRAMRQGQKGRKDEDFERELDSVLGLYRFTDDKDVFRAFYHRALAKRLLLEKSASDDFEKAMLKKLKEQYDPEFSMGDHMFNDLALSRDTMREYYAHRERQGDDASSHQLNVMVLQRSFWPFTARKSEADLPVNMQSELTKYTAFYKIKHQGHKLDWDHGLGTATLRARFDKGGEKELSVSLYQALVLLLFNEDTEIGFLDIKERTSIEDGELRRTLQSLAVGKKRVLKKYAHGKDIRDEDIFYFNSDFEDPAYRVHINSIQVKETEEETKKTHTLVEGDRKHVLDAAIVRIMKAKRELHNEQLKAATIDAVKNHFVPNVNMIKDRIDELVEQEYLKRHETDMNVFVYVA